MTTEQIPCVDKAAPFDVEICHGRIRILRVVKSGKREHVSDHLSRNPNLETSRQGARGDLSSAIKDGPLKRKNITLLRVLLYLQTEKYKGSGLHPDINDRPRFRAAPEFSSQRYSNVPFTLRAIGGECRPLTGSLLVDNTEDVSSLILFQVEDTNFEENLVLRNDAMDVRFERKKAQLCFTAIGMCRDVFAALTRKLKKLTKDGTASALRRCKSPQSNSGEVQVLERQSAGVATEPVFMITSDSGGGSVQDKYERAKDNGDLVGEILDSVRNARHRRIERRNRQGE
ncbi:hypothetical protein B0H16DRAFT_1462913 [Mycena metata]|uniref:Uncharacterized protein n=1 Tax=Mycena metata TaxID=1033252 RepID=A0AAD7N5B6_9AGAR|nr:hypothetical protein B0H16DRAFT_1470699 [Mycena metata]KAJ7745080.1 hypothetical protein B0H16DRAFT_1462913 [Mycena metata]